MAEAPAAAAEAERLGAQSRTATSALKRSLNARVMGDLKAQLDYDSWLTVVAATRA